MNYTYRLKQRGQTLVETMFVLAVLALIIAVAGKFYSSTRFNANVNNTVQDVNYILGATANYTLGNIPSDTTYGDDLFGSIQASGFLPNTMDAGSPFGGQYTVKTAKGGYIEVGIAPIPEQACIAVCSVMRTNLTSFPDSCNTATGSTLTPGSYVSPAPNTTAVWTSANGCSLQFNSIALSSSSDNPDNKPHLP